MREDYTWRVANDGARTDPSAYSSQINNVLPNWPVPLGHVSMVCELSVLGLHSDVWRSAFFQIHTAFSNPKLNQFASML